MSNLQACTLGVVLFLTGGLSALLALLARVKNPGDRAATFFSLLAAAIAVYTLGYGFELAAGHLAGKLFWSDVQYLAVPFIPALWLVFIVEYTGSGRRLRPWVLPALFVVPALTTAFKLTGHAHGLLYRDSALLHLGRLTVLFFERGPWYNIYAAYGQAAVLAGLVLIAKEAFTGGRFGRGRLICLLAAALVPAAAFTYYSLAALKIDIIAPAFAIATVVAYQGLRPGFFDLFPVARDKIFDHMSDAIIVLDTGNRVSDANRALLDLLPAGSRPAGREPGNALAGFPALAAFCRDAEAGAERELAGPGDRHFNVRAMSLEDRRKRFLGRLVIIRDITARRHAEQSLMKKEELQRLMVNLATGFINAPTGQAGEKIGEALETVGKFAGLDRAYIFAYDRAKNTVESAFDWCAPGIARETDTLRALPVETGAELFRKHRQGGVLIVPRADALPPGDPLGAILERRQVKAMIAIPLLRDGEFTGYIGFDAVRRPREFSETETDLLKILAEIFKNFQGRIGNETALRETEEKLRHDALHDNLTGLANRVLLEDRIEQIILHNRRNPDNHFMIMYLDLDDFKRVNDEFGHEAGDRLLVLAAGRLADCVRTEDTLARIGGDEFAILAARLPGLDFGEKIARRILQAFDRPFAVADHMATITASIGVCHYAAGITDAGEYLRNADKAMYKAKKAGKNRFVYFDAAMYETVARRMIEETRLWESIRDRELAVHFQPIMDLATGRVAGYEALARWKHPEKGLLAAGAFLPMAESSGLIINLGEWLIEYACGQAWLAKAGDARTLHVNLSARQFFSREIPAAIRRALADKRFPPGRLCLEITEATLMEGESEAAFARIRETGAGIILDEFGRGYSPLGYLHGRPVDGLKIDRALIAGLPAGKRDAQITRAIIALGKGLGIPVTAVGVENRAQAEQLKQWGCDFAQGFYWGRPQPAEAWVERA